MCPELCVQCESLALDPTNFVSIDFIGSQDTYVFFCFLNFLKIITRNYRTRVRGPKKTPLDIERYPIHRDSLQYHHEKVPPHSSLLVCSLLIPAVPRFFEDIKARVQDHFPALSISQTKKQEGKTVPELRSSVYTKKTWLRRSLASGVITVCCILSYRSLPIVPFHQVNFP